MHHKYPELRNLAGIIFQPMRPNYFLGPETKTNFYRFLIGTALVLLAFVWQAKAEQCSTSTEIDAATKSAIGSTAMQWFNHVSQGNGQALAAAGIPDISSNVSGVNGILQEHKALAGS